MTVDDDIARLRAGLARDAELAAAAVGDRPGSRWVVHGSDVWAVTGSLTGPHRCDQHDYGVPNHCDDEPVVETDINDRFGAARAEHVARQGPQATLDRVEKLRELAEYAHGMMGHNDPDCSDAGRLAHYVVETLASIYPEEGSGVDR